MTSPEDDQALSPRRRSIHPSSLHSPRYRAEQDSHPPNLAGFSYTKLEPTLDPLASSEEYTDDEVEKRLQAVSIHAKRALAPRSQMFLETYQNVAILLLDETDEERKETFQVMLQRYDQFLSKNQSLLKKATPEQLMLRENWTKLKEYEYFHRYGAYLTYQTTIIRQIAEERRLEGYQTLQNYWITIAQNLASETKLARKHDVPLANIPSYMAVFHVAKEMGIEFEIVCTTIQTYADPNSLIHSPVTQLIQMGKFDQLRQILHRDERDLELSIPPKRSEEIVPLLQTIASIKAEYFEIDPLDPDDVGMWTYNAAARRRLEEQQSLAEARCKDLAEKVARRTEEHLEKQRSLEALLAAAVEERMRKRQVSPEVSESLGNETHAEGKKAANLCGFEEYDKAQDSEESVEKIEQRLVGLQKEVQRHESALSRIFQKQDEETAKLEAAKVAAELRKL